MKLIHNSILILLAVILLMPVVTSALPTSTNTNSMWVSENASEFWFINNPSDGLENEITVFHYNSEFELVEEFNPEGLEEINRIGDFVRMEDGKWVLVSTKEVKIFDNSWNLLNSSEIVTETLPDSANLIEKDGIKIVLGKEDYEFVPDLKDQEWNSTFYSYDLNLQTLDLENKASIAAIRPDQYPPEEGAWINFKGYHFRTEVENVGPDNNFTRERNLTSVDGQVENGTIWILEGVLGGYKKGGDVYKYTLDMEYMNNSYSVGLNQSQIKLNKGISPIAAGPYLSLVLILVFVSLVVVCGSMILYRRIKS